LLVLREPAVRAALGATLVSVTAGFTVYTYISPIVQRAASIGSDGVSGMLLAFGVAAIAGNALGGSCSDHLGPFRTMRLGLAGMSAALAALGFLAATPTRSQVVGVVVTAGAVTLWSITGWALAVPIEHRLIELVPRAQAVALALNASALYLGIALGGVIGGAALAIGTPAVPAFTGAGLALLAVALLGRSTRSGARCARSAVR
jgi:MFS transporter, DHA1 family, inner membrane transport protein